MGQVINQTGFVEDIWAGTKVPVLADYAGGVAMELPVDADVGEAAAYFGMLELIVIPFEKSADGRGFSQAALLRALGFEGHIRAKGHVLVDQFRAAVRSGFTDVEISDAQAVRNPEQQWNRPVYKDYLKRLF